MQSCPLFIIGAPRSGTTFLCSTLNVHPSIHLTNECRIFALLKQMVEVDSRRADLLTPTYLQRFERFSRRTLGAWVERFYREELGVSTPIWGDKHPPYADPTILSARTGAVAHLPMSGSCLRLIRETLPQARFIHLHRHPAHVAKSMVRKHWIGSVEDGVRVWAQYVSEIVEFFGELPEEQALTFSYRDLIESPQTTATSIGHFLDLADVSPIVDFLARQRELPTPFSEPITDIADLYAIPAANRDDDRLLQLAGPGAIHLGYADASKGPLDRPPAAGLGAL
ncbi:sulfotransferase family protein [Trinickia symbiotica]|uniref:Sulfotransferase n=1 Tax=Trinickia symbiotica TaxID=863227 RepID=A0A2N7XA04_9BURK|nr:sulfotransferase [Trinickia symbiotica]PMS38305.1 sulfotransferase [Trinickia symbiotica]PPK47183.1 sulfotransferase family protein [Trinickia symbiotica]